MKIERYYTFIFISQMANAVTFNFIKLKLEILIEDGKGLFENACLHIC